MYFFFNDTATTEIYTLSLHDALPISVHPVVNQGVHHDQVRARVDPLLPFRISPQQKGREGHREHLGSNAVHGSKRRSEEHTSELQSRQYLVCRLLLEKKKRFTLSFLF